MDTITETTIQELEILVNGMRELRLRGKEEPKARNVKIPPVVEFVDPMPKFLDEEMNHSLKEISEASVMSFIKKVNGYLSHIETNCPTFSFQYVFREVIRRISQVCPTQQLILEEYVNMSAPSIETHLQCLSTLQMCSSEQRSYLRRYQHELVAHQEFVTLMTTILDEQDRLIRVLITRIQNATTV